MEKFQIKHRATNDVIFECKLSAKVANLSLACQAGFAVQKAIKSGVDLSYAGLSNANLLGSNLSGVNLSYADLSNANLSDANLYCANLYCADLRGANLRGADLRGANLRGASLFSADLTGVNLKRADITCVNDIIDAGTRVDGYRFVGWIKDGVLMIRAGCRDFTLAEYRKHNAKRYDGAIKKETAAILTHIKATAIARGMIEKG